MSNQPTNNNVVNMPQVSIDFEVSHLPVLVGDVKMKFIDTPENFAKLERISKDPENYAREAIGDMSDDFDAAEKALKVDGAGFAEMSTMLGLQKKAYTVIMDEIFMPGNFNRLYDRYPDLLKIMALMPTIMKIIGEASGRSIAMRDEQFKKQADDLLRKRGRKHKQRKGNNRKNK